MGGFDEAFPEVGRTRFEEREALYKRWAEGGPGAAG